MSERDDGGGGSGKTHHKRQAGTKANKKKAKDPHQQEMTDKQRNPKAFAFHSVNKTAKAVRRTLDIKERKHHIPVVDRTPVEPPPVLIAVVGPPKVGKTTLIQCLIKSFTRQKLANIQGPVTIVSGKKRRITIVECNNDINCMIDLAKVADLVLLLVDASFGFEMEIFEFLNICQVHGFPKIMGVLTHLDHFKQNKVLSKTKKKLKHRFWTEVYQGAKLFYLSGMVNGEYQKTEIHNLGRFISVMKFRPLLWRTTHPYIVADRMEDVTDPELVRTNPKVDRSVCLYGYVRGTHFKNNSNIHIPGSGDFSIRDMSYLHDPCPLPSKEKKRSLNEKERLIYAPMSGVGGLVYDKDAVYIDLGGSHSHQVQEEEKEENELVSSMIDTQETLDQKMQASQMTLFSGAAPISNKDIVQKETQGVDYTLPREEQVTGVDGRVRRRAVFKDEEMDSEGAEDSDGEEDSDDEEDSEDEEDSQDDITKEDTPSGKEESLAKSPKQSKVSEEAFAFDDDSDDDLQILDVQLPSHNDESGTDRDARSDSSDEEDSEHEESKADIKKDAQIIDKSYHDKNTDSVPRSKLKIKDDEIASKVKTILKGLSSKEKVKDKTEEEQGESGEEGEGEESGYDEDDMDVDEESEEEDEEGNEEEEGSGDDEEDDIDSDQETGHLKWKDNLAEKASESFYRRQLETPNLRRLVYGQGVEGGSDEDSEDEVGGLFKVARRAAVDTQAQRAKADALDCSRFTPVQLQEWDFDQVMAGIRDCFVTGKWEAAEDAETLLREDDELYGDFEDLETGEVHHGKDGEKEEEEEEEEDSKEEDAAGGMSREQYKEAREKKIAEKRKEKKQRMKKLFDSQYDGGKDGEGTYFDSLKAEMEQQAEMNRKEFEEMDEEQRAQYEGFRPGVYVRIQIDRMPCEFTANFDPTYPIILGSLLSAEQNIGYVQVRLKKHRWHKKILKTRDPLIVSLGWRRFQTVVLYSIQDHNGRHRLLKYTPEHLHCSATMWGPITPQGTGMLAVQTLSGAAPGFRVSATGVVLEIDKSMTIVKKLKLTGTPMKIYKKTAMIQNMFNSALEVAKFEGSSIKTVSGIRGQIKKAVKTPDGAFRATFEDKIKLSDIAFVRTWYPVQVPKFYNPVTTLLMPADQRNQWQGMKTVGQLRREKNIKREVKEDHLYKPIVRKERVFAPLTIPRELQRNLPFKDKPKMVQKIKDPVQSQRIAVVREPKERKVAELMKMLKVLHEDKMKTRRKQMRARAAQHQKEQAWIDNKRQAKTKEVKKQIYRALGKAEKRKNKYNKD